MLHLPLTDTLVAPEEPLPYPRVEAGDTACQAHVEDFLEFRLKGDDGILFGVYQDWVHQNTGNHLDGLITEDIKWQARWETIVCLPTQHYDAPFGTPERIVFSTLSVELDGI